LSKEGGGLGRVFVVAGFVFMIYVVFTGALTLVDLIVGFSTAIVVGVLSSDLVVKNSSKAFELRRWVYLLFYTLKYLTVYEFKAHLDVVKRILSPKLPVNPAIVRVPYEVDDEYAVTTIANSITNTPGTVVVDIDVVRKVMYVHWIDAKAVEDFKAREYISEDFEKYATKIFG